MANREVEKKYAEKINTHAELNPKAVRLPVIVITQ